LINNPPQISRRANISPDNNREMEQASQAIFTTLPRLMTAAISDWTKRSMSQFAAPGQHVTSILYTIQPIFYRIQIKFYTK